MRHLTSLALLLAIGATASTAADRASARRRRPPRCVALSVADADAQSGASRGRHRRVFSAAETADLRLEAWVQDDWASLPVQVKLFTPRGKLYQVLELRAGETGSAHPLRRRVAARLRMQALGARFPVAGTHVTMFSLFGEWRAEAYIDGAERPCARPLSFAIEP